MLKLKDVYASNPALGDPNMLDKKVEENAQKLDAIRQELQKYEVKRKKERSSYFQIDQMIKNYIPEIIVIILI